MLGTAQRRGVLGVYAALGEAAKAAADHTAGATYRCALAKRALRRQYLRYVLPFP